MGRGKKWEKKHENALTQGAGIYGINWIKKKTGDSYPEDEWPGAEKGRSRDAIYAKARDLLGPGGLSRGSYSLKQAIEQTGYTRSQLLRAREALAQKWKRTSAKGSYLIYESQLLDLAAWLGKDYWSKKHHLYGCLWCTTEDRPHRAQGLCLKCFNRYIQRLRRLGLPTTPKQLLIVLKMKIEVPENVSRHLRRGRALAGDLWKIIEEFNGTEKSDTEGSESFTDEKR